MATASDTAPAGVAEPVSPAGGEMPLATGDLAVAGWERGADAPSKSDRYLARRLAAASADYKGVALTTFLLGAAVAGGVWLAIGVLVEHWLVPGGLSATLRWAWLGAAAVALAAAALRWLVPLVRYRVNLVYAARAIEREHPELHNDLVNTVLAKAHPATHPEKVIRSLERRTAKRLAAVPAEAVIDRSVPLRLACVLAVLVGLAGLYELAAPKSLFVSAARLVAPWVGWAAPSRVRIESPRLAWRMPAEQGEAAAALERRRLDIEAGAATLVRGRQLVVASDIRGLRQGEKPIVVVAPLRSDGSVDPAAPAWRVEMTRGQSAGGERMFTAMLPDATRGLDQSVEIVVAAGDARSPAVRVAVVDSPTLLVREIRYTFPGYTRRAPETVAWQGDIRAVEGTEVTIVAESNQPLEDAWIDFDGDGGRELRFTKSATDLTRATKSFHLHRKADGSGPEHASYRLVFQPQTAAAADREQAITDPLEHRIEVLADLAPEVAIEEPRESPVRVPPAAPVTVRVQALDPDFALVRVGLETRLQGGPVGQEIVVLEKEHQGVFRGSAQLVPERLGAGPGATLEYRAVAVDNRPKRPNISHSPWQALRIDSTAPPRQPEQPPPGRGRSDDGRSQGQGRDQTQAGGQNDSRENEKRSPQDRRSEERQDTPQQNRAPDEKQEGKQDGQAEGAQNGERQQQQDGKQAGDQQGQGQNQGQGAERGQGVGAQGQRQGGQEQQTGKQEPGGKQAGGQQTGGQDPGGPQAGGQQPGGKRSARENTVAADGTNDGEAMERILEHRREQGSEGQGKEGQGKEGQGKEGQGKEGQGKEGGARGEGRQPGDPRVGGQQPGTEGEHEHAPCTGADGKPCGKEGCPTCKGQGGGKEGGGGSDSGDGKQGAQPGRQGAGGSEGASGEPGAGKSDQGTSEGQGAAGEGEGAAGEGQGAAGEGEGAAGEGQRSSSAAGDTQAGGQKPGDKAQQGEGAGGNKGAGTAAAQQSGDSSPSNDSGQPGSGSGQTASSGWAGGDSAQRADGRPLPDGPPPSKKTEWGAQDLANARNAADLALEHLRKAVDSGEAAVLDRLGWTRDEAQAFLDRWEKMRRLAESADPVERGEFERAVRSLGLRPAGVRSSRDVPADARGGQAEGRRSRPPADYQEQFKAYTQGTAGE